MQVNRSASNFTSHTAVSRNASLNDSSSRRQITSQSQSLLIHYRQQFQIEYYTNCASCMFVWISLIILFSLRLPSSSKFFVHKQLLLAYALYSTLTVVYHDDVTYAMLKNRTLCTWLAILNHYLSTTYFSCMFVEGLHICYKLKSFFEGTAKSRRHMIYVLIGWGLPMVITIAVASNRIDLYQETKNCYTMNGKNKWIWKGPVFAILMLNIICFMFILFIVLRRFICGKRISNVGNFYKIKSTLRTVMASVPLLGVTFLLGFIIDEDPIPIGYIFVTLNEILGFLFFVFHIVMDEQVRKQFLKQVFGAKDIVSTVKGKKSKISKAREDGFLNDVAENNHELQSTESGVSNTTFESFYNETGCFE